MSLAVESVTELAEVVAPVAAKPERGTEDNTSAAALERGLERVPVFMRPSTFKFEETKFEMEGDASG